MAWYRHIEQHPHHRHHINHISRESYDILFTLCNSLIQLIIEYRQYYPTHALLPWLHSTEVCEHVFGLLRQLKKDFNYADMLYLERKLRILMMGEFRHLSDEGKADAVASGYHHTYFHAPDLDLAVLMQWPTDSELQMASKHSVAEASQLLSAVGIEAAAMLASYSPPKPSSPKKHADAPSQPLAPQSMANFLMLYTQAQEPVIKSAKTAEEIETCELALVADDVDQTLSMYVLSESIVSDSRS